LFNNLLWGSPDTEDEQTTARRRVQTVMRDQKMKALFEAGKSSKEIAIETGFSLQTVYGALRREGVELLIGAPRRRARPKGDRNAAIIEKYKNGASVNQIGTEYGVTRERVCQILRPHNLTNIKLEQRRVARELAESEREAIKEKMKGDRAAQVAAAIEIVRAGGSRNDAVRQTGLPVHLVLDACDKAGLPRHHGRWKREAEFQDRIKQIREKREQGKTWEEIGRAEYSWAIRHMPDVKSGRGKRHKKTPTEPRSAAIEQNARPASDPWTEERIIALRRMYFDGCSTQQIADVLGEGITRNAVIGKTNRLRAEKQLLPLDVPASEIAE
jgi:hypothetical protein